MNLEEFKKSIREESPPKTLTHALQALWHEANGDWDQAHDLCQEGDTSNGAWVHAYLHRKEGDQGNAEYWYSRAGKPPSKLSLDDEWSEIAKELL